MLWFKLAWRNIWRNPGRTCIQLLAIAGSLAMVIWLQNTTRGSYNKMINDGVRMGSGHLSLNHPQYPEKRLPELVFKAKDGMALISEPDAYEAKLPRLHIAGLARSSYEARAAMITGIDFSQEKAINPLLSPKRKIAGELPDESQTNLAYVGSKLCETLRLQVGNKLVVMMQDFDGQIASKLFRIGGIFTSGVQQIDKNCIFVNRQSLARSLGKPDAVHEIALILKKPDSLQKNMALLQQNCQKRSDIAPFTWEVTSKQLADTIKMDHFQLKVMFFIFFILVAIGTVNLLLMSVLERTREFGLLQALGLGRSGIRTLILSEALLLGLVGCLTGFIAGTALSFYTWHYGLDLSGMFGPQEVAGMLFEPVIKSAWEWQWMTGLTLTMLVLVVLASIYPTNKALRLGPAQAMRLY